MPVLLKPPPLYVNKLNSIPSFNSLRSHAFPLPEYYFSAPIRGVSCFFARPYHSWERGLNEHTNGLLRQFFPKGTNFKRVCPEYVQKVADLINHRPRKSLDFLTPYQVLFSHASDPVALQS
jgi:hypothetical protein